MKSMEIIKSIRQQMLGVTLITVGRTCNMLELGFSSPEMAADKIWHIQCPFRVIQENKIIITDGDIYIPCDPRDSSFNCGLPSSISVFDKLANHINDSSDMPVVDDVRISLFGDVKILLHNKKMTFIIECFNNSSAEEDDENWRFFQHHSSEPHIVCYRDKLTCE